MRIVCLQHADYEAPEAVADWAAERGHVLECVTPLFEEYPATGDFDMLVVMGGPMGAYEDVTYPWLVAEKRFIREAIDAGRLVFGVCLGGQLVATALGGSVHPHDVREVGWLPAHLTAAGRASRVLSVLPDEFVVGLWHGDSFDLPVGIETAAVTEACANQAFEACDGRVVGLQFHLEWSAAALRALAARHREWFEQGGPYVQSEREFTEPGAVRERAVVLLHDLLDRMEAIR